MDMCMIVQLTTASGAHYRASVSLAETIRTAREARGWTQTALGVASGVSTRYISSLENGQNASMEVVRRVAAALDLDTVPIGGGRTLDFTELPPRPAADPPLDPGVRLFVDRLVSLRASERVALADLLQMFAAAIGAPAIATEKIQGVARETRNGGPSYTQTNPTNGVSAVTGALLQLPVENGRNDTRPTPNGVPSQVDVRSNRKAGR